MLQENKLHINREDLYVLNSLKYRTKQLSDKKLSQSDPDVLFEKSKEFGLIHCVFDYYRNSKIIRSEGSPFFLHSQVADEYFLLLKKVWVEVNKHLREADIYPLVCKGFHLLNTVYREQSKYIINDIDILVRKDQLDPAKEIMKSIGYSQNVVNTDNSTINFVENNTISEFEKNHYELFPFTKIVEAPQLNPHIEFIKRYLEGHPFIIEENKVYVAVELDIHHNLSMGFDDVDIWKNYNKFEVNNSESYALSYDTLGWFLPARLYYEVMVFNNMKLKMLADLTNIIINEKLNYDSILEIADKYYLHPSLLYVYTYLKRIVGLSIPQKFLKQLDLRVNIRSSYRDWGDFIPKIVNTRVITTGFIAK